MRLNLTADLDHPARGDLSRERALQFHRLRKYLQRQVYPFSRYYRESWDALGFDPRDLQRPEDWQEVPFTSKTDLLPTEDNPKRARDFVLIPGERELARQPATIARAFLQGRESAKQALAREYRPVLMTSTTGRSTDPVPFLYTGRDLDRLQEAGKRIMEIGNSRPEFRHLNCFPYAPHLGFWQVHYASLGFNSFCLSTGGGKVMGTAGNVAMLAKVQPDVLIGMPTFIYHLLQEAAEEGVHLDSLSLIVLGGEKVPTGIRRKLRALCAELGAGRVDVLATYAFTEAKQAWIECRGGAETGYHLYPDLGFVEIVDPDSGEPVGDHEPGEIVFTSLDARGTAVVRYRTGDRIDGGLTWEPCPHCHRQLPRLVGKISRVSDFRHLELDKIKGTLVDFNELEHMLDDVDGVGSWQVELRKRGDDPFEMDELIIHAQRTGRVRQSELKRRIEEHVFLATELRPNRIEFHNASELRRLLGIGVALKEERIVDHRPHPETLNPIHSTDEKAAV